MRKLILSAAVIMTITLFSCGNSGEKKQNDGVAPDTTKGRSVMAPDSMKKDQAALVYVCPCGGCPEVKESKPGKCPKCQLDLVEQKK